MATYYFRNVGTNWGDASNWSLTDGGLATGAVPTALDDAYFTSNSGNCTVNATARVCKTLIFSGVGAGNYANTFTVSNNVTVSGNVTLSATMTVSGSSNLRIDATSTLTSNGKTWTGGLTIVGNQTVTLGGNWTINGSFDTTNTSGTVTINSNTLTIGGSFTSTLTTGLITGTTSVVLNGTGTLATNSATTGGVQNNLTINTSGTITLGTLFSYNTRTLTYTAGTVTTTGSRLLISGAATLTTNGITWNDITFSSVSNVTITLSNNLTCSGNFNITQAAASFILNGNTFTIGGSFTSIYTTGTLSGTTTIVMNGTGTLATNIATTGGIRNSLTINSPSGTITLGTNLTYGTGTFTYTAGTVTTTGSTLRLPLTCTLATNGITWNNITTTNTTGNITITLSNNLTCAGDFTALGTSGDTNLTGSTFTIGGSLVSSLTSGLLGGTTNIILNGSGTLSTNSSTTNAIVSNLTINTTGTITIGTVLAFNTRTLTYTAGTVDATASTLRLFLGGCTLATDGIVWNNIISTTIANSATYTLSNNLTCTGNFTTLMASNTLTFTGSTFTIGGGFIANSLNGGSGFVTGTTNIVLNGTGTVSTNNAAVGGAVRNDLIVNTTGVITLDTVFSYGTGTFTYISGTVVTSGNTLLVLGGNYDSNGMVWNNITYPSVANNTITLSSNMTCTGNLTVTSLTNNTFTINGSILTVGGSFTANSLTTGLVTGTTSIVLNGTGTLSTNSTTTGGIRNNITINTTGAITLGNLFVYGGGTFTYKQGTIFTTTNNNFAIVTSATLINMNGLFSNRVTVTSGITLTMNEFFSGRAGTFTTVTPSSTTNYTITFQDRFEKFSRFIKISNATISNRGQLMVLSDETNQGNNIGIRFATNQLANGLPKNNPNGFTQNVFSAAGLIKDPCLS